MVIIMAESCHPSAVLQMRYFPQMLSCCQTHPWLDFLKCFLYQHESVCQRCLEAIHDTLVQCQIRRSFAPLSLWVKAPELFPNQWHASYSSVSPHGDILLSTEMRRVDAYLSAPLTLYEGPNAISFSPAAVLSNGLTSTPDQSHFLGSGSFQLCHVLCVWPSETLKITEVIRAANGPEWNLTSSPNL